MKLKDTEQFEKDLKETLKWLKKEMKSKDSDAIDIVLQKLIISEYKRILKNIKEVPVVDEKMVRPNATWIGQDAATDYAGNIIGLIKVCSNCYKETVHYEEGMNYCPYCGAKMYERLEVE